MIFDERNGKRKVYNIDLDGVLTNGEYYWEKEPTPNLSAIDVVRHIYSQGNTVIIWTARSWECAPETVGWLIKCGVPFHGIYMAKGGSDVYVDDKNLDLKEFFKMEKTWKK